MPAAGSYDIVFDTLRTGSRARSRSGFGSATPLRRRSSSGSARSGGAPPSRSARPTPAAGIDPASFVLRVDGRERPARLAAGRILVATNGLRPGRHTVFLQVSDYQESRNMENVAKILPNTRILRARFTVTAR